MEEWRKIERFKRVEVSNLGNVRTVWPHKIKEIKPMLAKTTVGSYLKVSVTEKETGKQVQIGIHNLVAEVFIPIPEERQSLKLEPNHKDGDKHNNQKENLEWMTRQENLKHAIATGLRKVVDENGKALYIDKSKPVKVTDIETGVVTMHASAKEAAEITMIPARTVQYNAFKRDKKAPVKGFLFEPAT